MVGLYWVENNDSESLDSVLGRDITYIMYSLCCIITIVSDYGDNTGSDTLNYRL